ncbi:MAG: hypothetical protein AAFY60_09310, partial [Myxococcota bacterium]
MTTRWWILALLAQVSCAGTSARTGPGAPAANTETSKVAESSPTDEAERDFAPSPEPVLSNEDDLEEEVPVESIDSDEMPGESMLDPAVSESAGIGGLGTHGSVSGKGEIASPSKKRKRASRGATDSFSPPRSRPRPSAPALKAGRHDDNAQYNRFLQFLTENARLAPYPVDVSERLVVRTLDQEGKALHNCEVQVKSLAGETRSTSTTYA